MNQGLEGIIRAVCKTTHDLWTLGWAEANGGNISWRLGGADEEAVKSLSAVGEWVTLPRQFPSLAGEYFLVTTSGSYLRNVELTPENLLGIVQLADDGAAWRPVWGFVGGGKPTSEFSAHLGSHAAIKRKSIGRDRVVVHTHASNAVALTFTQQFDAHSYSRLIWSMGTECIVVFPEGIGFVPLGVPGSLEIAADTERTMEKFSALVWEHHGVFGSGATLDEAFGRVHVIDKIAGIYLKAAAVAPVTHRIGDEMLKKIAVAMNCNYNRDFLP